MCVSVYLLLRMALFIFQSNAPRTGGESWKVCMKMPPECIHALCVVPLHCVLADG